MILDCVAYRGGKPQAVPRTADGLHDVVKAQSAASDFVWMLLQDPSFEELGSLQEVFGLHPLAVEDAVSAHQRPKIEIYGSAVFVVLRPLRYDTATDTLHAGEVSLFAGPGYVVVVRHGAWPALDEATARIEASEQLLRHGAVGAVYHVVDAVVDGYQTVSAALTEDVEEVESSVFSQEPPSETTRVYLLKRELLEFRRAVLPIHEPLDDIVRGRARFPVPDPLVPYFRDVADHLVRTQALIDALDSRLDNVMQARATQISVQQNDDMRKLAAYAAMFAAPTLVAGVYGMNFKDMPELSWAAGYPLALLLMVVSVLVLWRLFKRSGWL